MQRTATWMVVVTYSEWLNWMAWGELRLNTRIGRVYGPDDAFGFAQLINRAPDLRVADEQAFVLATLKPDFRALLRDVPGSTLAEVATLSLKAVEAFHPVTERAGRLLAADAHRAQARLAAPIFENAWNEWAALRRSADADRRGRVLASVLGLPEPDVDAIPGSVRPYLFGEHPPPNAGPLEILEGRRAYAWAATFGLLEPLAGIDAKRDLAAEFQLADVVKKRKQDFALGAPILQDTDALTTVVALASALRDRHGINVSLPQSVVFWHYEQLLRKRKDVALESLVDDLASLAAASSPATAATAAWLIGRLMEDAAVTTLQYAVGPSDWPAMAPAAIQPESIDVSKLASAKRPCAGEAAGLASDAIVRDSSGCGNSPAGDGDAIQPEGAASSHQAERVHDCCAATETPLMQSPACDVASSEHEAAGVVESRAVPDRVNSVEKGVAIPEYPAGISNVEFTSVAEEAGVKRAAADGSRAQIAENAVDAPSRDAHASAVDEPKASATAKPEEEQRASSRTTVSEASINESPSGARGELPGISSDSPLSEPNEDTVPEFMGSEITKPKRPPRKTPVKKPQEKKLKDRPDPGPLFSDSSQR